MRAAGKAHFGGVYVIHAVVVRLAVFCEYILHPGIYLVAVHIERLLGHLYTAEGLQRTLEGLVGLQADYLFEILIYIARAVGGESGDYGGIGF